MGNNQSSNWRAEFDLTDGTGNIRKAIHRQTRQRYEALTLFPGSEEEAERVMTRIKSRISKPSPHLLHLHSFWTNNPSTACSNSPTIDLLFRSATPLEQYLTLRKIKNQTFAKEQVQHVIERVATALNDIREMREEYGCIDLGTIFVDGDVKLKDPILMRETFSGIRGKKLRGYPSPQKLYTFYDTLSSFQEHTSDLFSLGIVALQLIYPHQNLSSLYRNANSQYLNCSIDMNQLKVYVNGVQDYTLRKYVAVLTDQQSNRRREIYHLIQGKAPNVKNLRLLIENPYEIANIDGNHNPQKQITQIEQLKKPQKVSRTASETIIPPQRQSAKVQFNHLPREAQSFSFPIQNPIPFNVLTSAAHSVSVNGNYKYEADSWRPSHTFSSNFGFMDSESTPINKINGANINSFRSPSYDFSLSKAPLPLQTGINTYRPQFQLSGKVSPKLIDATYHSSFVTPTYPTPDVQETTNIWKKVQSVEEAPIVVMPQIKNQQKLNNHPPEEQQQQRELPSKTISRQEESPQLQVKTSKQAIQNIKNSLIETATNNESTQNMIKFQSMRSKMVQSVNQLQKIQKQGKSPVQKDGYVVQEFDIGTRYQGFKKDGMRNGQGQFVYKEGSRYKGEWKDNKMQGYGILYYPNGQVAYQGQWKDDQFHGLGTVYNDNPVTIKGGFDYTNFNSLDEEWLKYEGNLKRDAKDGQGKLYLTNGEVYTGNFENDYVHGQGFFKRYNGSIIRGMWQEGLLKKIHPS